MKRILVTGGAGFLGSNLCEHLLAAGYYVICLDDLSTGNYANIRPFMDESRFDFVNGSVTEPLDFQVDEIYNLACPASPPLYQADPVMTAKTNFLGALHVLELATKCRATVLQASTSEIYGNPKVHPQVEDYHGNVNPIGIRACYDEGKRIGETLFFDFFRQYGTNVKVVRIFNTYGPNMLKDDGRVVSNFIVKALCGQDITVYGDGSQTRSFCYVDDLIRGLIKVMEKENFTGPVNLGNPHEITVLELAQRVIDKIDTKSAIVFCQLPQDDPYRRKPCIDFAVKELGWQPYITLEQGLEKTIRYFRKKLGSHE